MTHLQNPGISVVIRTRNRKTNLEETLKSLAKQKTSTVPAWEIILIDNHSVDNTASYAQECWHGFGSPVPCRILPESRIGKMVALITGIKHALYDYVIICDDDNWLSTDYIQKAYEIMTGNIDIGMLGGMGIPAFEQDRPYWFDLYQPYYCTGDQHPTNGEVEADIDIRFVWGAGSVLNRYAFLKLLHAGFEKLPGKNVISNESDCGEIELSLAIQLSGYKLWYDNSLIFFHYIPKEKVPWSYLMKRVHLRAKARPYLLMLNAIHAMKIDTQQVNADQAYQNYYLPSKKRFMRSVLRSMRTVQGINFFLRCLTKNHIEFDSNYFNRYVEWQTFFAWSKFNRNMFFACYKAISALKAN